MKRVKLSNGSIIDITYSFKRLELVLTNSSGQKIDRILELPSFEIEFEGKKIKILVKKHIFLTEPIVDIVVDGIKCTNSDTHPDHVLLDFKHLLYLLLVGNLFYLINSEFDFFTSKYLLACIKAFAVGLESLEIVTFGLGLGIEIVALFLIKKRKMIGVLLVMLLLIVDSALCFYFFDPQIFLFSLIVRIILLRKIFYLGSYSLLKK